MRGSLRRRSRVVTIAAALAVAALALPSGARAQTGPPGEDAVVLEQNFPNPFTPGVGRTIFTFTLPAESRVRLVVYNLLAQEVAVLVDEKRARGRHRVAWDGIDDKEQPLPAGVYWYKLEVEDRRPLLKRLRVLDVAAQPSPGPGAQES